MPKILANRLPGKVLTSKILERSMDTAEALIDRRLHGLIVDKVFRDIASPVRSAIWSQVWFNVRASVDRVVVILRGGVRS